jgi:DNA modification methylase
MTIPQNLTPNIEQLPLSALKPNPKNARTHSAKQIEQIATSIRRFGWVVPVVVDEHDRIVAGHGRYAAARKLQLDMVPAIRVAFLTDEDRRAFALAENRIAELSGWDSALLSEELNALFESGYELELTGFSLADLDFAIPESTPENKPEQIELPDPSALAISQPGDLWRIGPHRLLCGDARDPVGYETLLGDERADIVFGDPPYNVEIDGHVSGNGKVRHREFAMASGEMSPPEFTAFLRSVFRNCVRFSQDGSIHYQCMDWRHIREILDAADGVYSTFKQLVVWAKTNGSQGAFYRSQHELVFVFKSGKAKHTNNFGLGESGRYRTNVVQYAGANTFRKGRTRDLADHSTVKPAALVADFLLDCSHRNDLVLDPFAGSGTSLIAAHKTGRRGAAIEIDPLYVDTSIRRLEAASALTAVDAQDRTFAERVAIREER